MSLYFVTVNSYKREEVKEYLKGSGVQVEVFPLKIQEILHLNLSVIVRDKVLKAYEQVRRPCVVEHGGLRIDSLGGLPGGLSKVVWDTIGDQLCSFFRKGETRAATAESVIGYCDGKQVHVIIGETRGQISERGLGEYRFQWDPIFVPEGSNQTYGEIGFPGKGKYSQAAKAWKKLVRQLKP